jgi:hypothetical protein
VQYVPITLVAVLAVFAIGCDPGMSISQIKPSCETTKGDSATAQIVIDVATSHVFIGNTRYVPQVRITNSSNASITITSVELISRGEVYANKPVQPGFYPLVVQPGKTEDLLVWFDLKNPVYETFKDQSQLQVHYRKDDKEEIVRTGVVGSR